MIIKIQRPLLTNNNQMLLVLVYNQDRSLIEELPYVAFAKLFVDPDIHKIYHEAEIIDTILHVGERVTDQEW